MMCGTGGMSISEWARLKSYRMVRLWLAGFGKRNDAIYTIGYCISRSAIKPWCKDLSKDYPYPLRRDDEPLEDAPEMNEEEAQAKLEQMKAALLERMRAKHPDNK